MAPATEVWPRRTVPPRRDHDSERGLRGQTPSGARHPRPGSRLPGPGRISRGVPVPRASGNGSRDHPGHQGRRPRGEVVQRARGQESVAPTSGSWLNLVEASSRSSAARRCAAAALPPSLALIAAIQRFIDAWNDRCTPSTWTKDPDTVSSRPRTSAAAPGRRWQRHLQERAPRRLDVDGGLGARN